MNMLGIVFQILLQFPISNVVYFELNIDFAIHFCWTPHLINFSFSHHLHGLCSFVRECIFKNYGSTFDERWKIIEPCVETLNKIQKCCYYNQTLDTLLTT